MWLRAILKNQSAEMKQTNKQKIAHTVYKSRVVPSPSHSIVEMKHIPRVLIAERLATHARTTSFSRCFVGFSFTYSLSFFSITEHLDEEKRFIVNFSHLFVICSIILRSFFHNFTKINMTINLNDASKREMSRMRDLRQSTRWQGCCLFICFEHEFFFRQINCW